MQSTTGHDGGSQARIIYHTPEKSFAWLHKEGSFADFQQALRLRLNISKNEPLITKQIDGDYTLDIETEEEYEAFCHFAKSASQLHISVNGGLRDQSKLGGIGSASFSTSASTALPSNAVPDSSVEPEDLTLGKRKASQITTDPETTLPVTQKKKKRRKVGPGQLIPAQDDSPFPSPPAAARTEQGIVSGHTAGDVADTAAIADPTQSTLPTTKRKKKKRKNAGSSQTDSMPPELVELHAKPATERADLPEPSPAGPSRTKRQKKTVMVELSTVIPSPATAQEPPPITPTAQLPLPKPVTEALPSTTRGITRGSSTKKKTKALVETPEPAPSTPTIPRPDAVAEPVSSGSTLKPKPPVSKPGFPRSQVYVEIITKKGKSGKVGGSSSVEKGSKLQEPVKKTAQLEVRKPKANLGESRAEAAKRTESPNAPSIQEIMDGVIAAAMLDAKTRSSTNGATTDVSENLTPPPQKKSKSMTRKPRPADSSGLGTASSATLLDTSTLTQRTADSDSVTGRKKTRTRKSDAKGTQSLRKNDGSSPVSNVRNRLDRDSPPPPSLFKKGTRLSVPLTAPPPNQKTTQKPSRVQVHPDEESSSEDEDSGTPKKKPALISDPDDELDAFMHALANPSQKSVLDDLPSDSEVEEEEAEREGMEVEEEDDAPKSKGSGYRELKVLALKVMGRTESSSNGDSDSEPVAADASVNLNQVQVNAQVTRVSKVEAIAPSSDLEDEEEPLSQRTKSTNVDQALSSSNERILDNPDPIGNEPSHVTSPDDFPEGTEDPVQNVDMTSTPKSKLALRAKGHDETVLIQKGGASSEETQSSPTPPPGSMLPPPTPLRETQGGPMLSQPIYESTPAVSAALRRKQLRSQTAGPETPVRSRWTTLTRGKGSAQSADDPSMFDELTYSPIESTLTLRKATPVGKPTSSASIKQTPLFLPSTSHYPIPSSDLPLEEEEESSSEEEKVIVPSPQRILRSSVAKNKMATPYQRLSTLARQPSIFPSTPIEPVGPTPTANKSQTLPGSDDDFDDEEDSGVSDSDLDSQPPTHIPKGRRAGVRTGGRGKERSQLSAWS